MLVKGSFTGVVADLVFFCIHEKECLIERKLWSLKLGV